MEVGYARLSIEGIAARAGVGKQTIYRWWPTKGAVLFDALLVMSEGADGIALPDTGDIERDLRVVLRASISELQEPRYGALLRALTAEIQRDLTLARDLVARLLGPQMAATIERLRRAQQAGQLPQGADLSIGVELLYGPVFHRWLLRTAPMNEHYADAVVSMALAAMRGSLGRANKGGARTSSRASTAKRRARSR